MKNAKMMILACLGSMTLASSANATVVYTFEALTMFAGSGSVPLNVKATVKTADFLTTSTGILSATCESADPAYNCSGPNNGIRFFTTDFAGYDAINFLVTTPSGLAGPVYYFADGAFGSVGAYSTIQFGAAQAGRLTVALEAVDSAVPEPATWAMMLVGFGAVGGAMRRGRTKQRVRFAFAG